MRLTNLCDMTQPVMRARIFKSTFGIYQRHQKELLFLHKSEDKHTQWLFIF